MKWQALAAAALLFDFPIQSMRLQRFTGETWELFGETIGGD